MKISIKSVLALILVAVLACCMLVGCKQKQPVETGGGGGVGLIVDPNQGDYVAPEKETAVGIAIPGWGEITLPPNTTDIVVDFYNPEENAGRYYLTYELRLPNENEPSGYEVLYKSGLIEPGKHIQRITLTHGLPEGEYEGTIHVQPYKMDAKFTPTNNADLKTKLIVVDLG